MDHDTLTADDYRGALALAQQQLTDALAEVRRLRAALEQLRDREMSRGSVEIIEAALRGEEGP